MVLPSRPLLPGQKLRAASRNTNQDTAHRAASVPLELEVQEAIRPQVALARVPAHQASLPRLVTLLLHRCLGRPALDLARLRPHSVQPAQPLRRRRLHTRRHRQAITHLLRRVIRLHLPTIRRRLRHMVGRRHHPVTRLHRQRLVRPRRLRQHHRCIVQRRPCIVRPVRCMAGLEASSHRLRRATHRRHRHIAQPARRLRQVLRTRRLAPCTMPHREARQRIGLELLAVHSILQTAHNTRQLHPKRSESRLYHHQQDDHLDHRYQQLSNSGDLMDPLT